MFLQYALYERTRNGYQWNWHAADLKESLLDDFLYRIQIPDDANTIRPIDLRGGILKFSQAYGSKVDEHVVLYRFFNGGSDEKGRSRTTMLTAWTSPTKFPAPPIPEANGVLKFFQNPMFKNVAEKAWTIGIEQPYSLIGDEPLPPISETPSPALAEFLNGLNDENHDYSLTIQNDNHLVQRTPSAAFKYKEAEATKRKWEDEQRKADQSRREAEEKKRLADERKQDANKGQRIFEKQKKDLDRLGKRKNLQNRNVLIDIIRILPLYAILIGAIIVVIGSEVICTLYYRDLAKSNQQEKEKELKSITEKGQIVIAPMPKQEQTPKNKQKNSAKTGIDCLSDAAQKVVFDFDTLDHNEKTIVLEKLQNITNEQP
jgi:hypothetical protein